MISVIHFLIGLNGIVTELDKKNCVFLIYDLLEIQSIIASKEFLSFLGKEIFACEHFRKWFIFFFIRS